MKHVFSLTAIALLVVLLICAAGCTSPSSSPAPTAPAATVNSQSGAAVATPATGTTAPIPSAAAPGIDTTISVHFNDYACLNIPQTLGVDYLNPGENYTIWVTTPGAGTITPNLLVVNVNDNAIFGTVKPAWDTVQKTWTYVGINPIVKLIDITSPQSGTLTVKKQGWYFVCIDDRKENGASSAVYQVPVKVTRA